MCKQLTQITLCIHTNLALPIQTVQGKDQILYAGYFESLPVSYVQRRAFLRHGSNVSLMTPTSQCSFETSSDCRPSTVPDSFILHRTRNTMAFTSFKQSSVPCNHVSTARNTINKLYRQDVHGHFHDNWSSLKVFSVSASVTIVGSDNIWKLSKSRCPKPSLRASSDTEPNKSASKHPSAIPDKTMSGILLLAFTLKPLFCCWSRFIICDWDVLILSGE